ncbi:MAG: hypothetical protein Q9O74_12635 [Planctomycetota bacterium]|nr:hypothetical protein [Planctomycetota bacterium]
MARTRVWKQTLPIAAIGLAALLVGPGGCASAVEGTGDFTFSSRDYPAAFDATRDVLRDYRFTLERIDAEAGVISTTKELSPGLLEPWSPLQTGFGDEWEDTLNRQARQVRVTFAPEGEDGQTMRASVWVTLLRQHRAGRRLDSEWVGASTFAFDPQLKERHTATYFVPSRRDGALEARLARRIEAEMRDGVAETQVADTAGADMEESVLRRSAPSLARGALRRSLLCIEPLAQARGQPQQGNPKNTKDASRSNTPDGNG